MSGLYVWYTEVRRGLGRWAPHNPLLTVPNITSMASLQSITGIMMIIKPSVDALPSRSVHQGEEELGSWVVPNVTSMASLLSPAGNLFLVSSK